MHGARCRILSLRPSLLLRALEGIFLTRTTAAYLALCAIEQSHLAKKSPFARAGPTGQAPMGREFGGEAAGAASATPTRGAPAAPLRLGLQSFQDGAGGHRQPGQADAKGMGDGVGQGGQRGDDGDLPHAA